MILKNLYKIQAFNEVEKKMLFKYYVSSKPLTISIHIENKETQEQMQLHSVQWIGVIEIIEDENDTPN
jgi:hypothetical protein